MESRWKLRFSASGPGVEDPSVSTPPGKGEAVEGCRVDDALMISGILFRY